MAVSNVGGGAQGAQPMFPDSSMNGAFPMANSQPSAQPDAIGSPAQGSSGLYSGAQSPAV